MLLLLRALAALTLGRLDHLPTIVGVSFALGVLQEGIVWNSQANEAEAKMAALTGLVIVLGLVFRRSRGFRSALDVTSWQAVGHARPIPRVFLQIPGIQVARGMALLVVLIFFAGFPYWGVFDTTVVVRMGLVLLYAVIMLSLGVLTGWSGQLDFLVEESKGEKFYNVSFDIQPVQEQVVWENVLIKESMWAFPREQSAKEKMRQCYEDIINDTEGSIAASSDEYATFLAENFSAERMYNEFVDCIIPLEEIKQMEEEVNSLLDDLL